MKRIDEHESIISNSDVDKGPVPLSHCLESFSQEEKISEVIRRLFFIISYSLCVIDRDIVQVVKNIKK